MLDTVFQVRHVYLVKILLGCGVWRTSTERVQLVSGYEFVTKTEIGYFNIHVAVEKQIFSLLLKWFVERNS